MHYRLTVYIVVWTPLFESTVY